MPNGCNRTVFIFFHFLNLFLCITYSVTLLLVRFGFVLLMVGTFMLVMALSLVVIVIRLLVLSVG
jgi:hypothetical protein